VIVGGCLDSDEHKVVGGIESSLVCEVATLGSTTSTKWPGMI